MKAGTIVWLALLMTAAGCVRGPPQPAPPPDREILIPPEQVKIAPDMDVYPPRSLTGEYTDPVPLPYPVNTACRGGLDG